MATTGATHTIEDGENRTFSLKPIEKAHVSTDAQDLAFRITAAVTQFAGDSTKLTRLRELAEVGLAAKTPDVAKATTDLDTLLGTPTAPPDPKQTPNSAATYSIKDEKNGVFALERINGVTPDLKSQALAERITKLIEALGTKDPAKLQLLRKAAVTGLAASTPDVTKAAAELDHDFPPPTYRITDETGGFFKLEPISTPTPDREAEALAAAIENEVDWLRGAAGEVGLAKLKTLREVAERGLAAATPNVEAAQLELRSADGFWIPWVQEEGLDDVSISLPNNIKQEQIDFVLRFQTSLRVVQQLHRGRIGSLGAILYSGKVAPDPIAAGTEAGSSAVAPVEHGGRTAHSIQGTGQPDPSSTWAEKPAFQDRRNRLIQAARFALPDRGSGRAPQLVLAQALVDQVVQETVADLGPPARSEYLTDLATNFAVVSALFAVMMVLLNLSWTLIFGADLHPPSHSLHPPSHSMFGLLLVNVAFLFIGAWVSAAQRLNSSDVSVVESVFAEPFDGLLRASVLLAVGLIVIVLLHKQVFVFSLGGENNLLSTAKILTSLPAAIVMGAFLGLSERALPSVLSERSKALEAQLAPKPPGTPPSAGAAAPK